MQPPTKPLCLKTLVYTSLQYTNTFILSVLVQYWLPYLQSNVTTGHVYFSKVDHPLVHEHHFYSLLLMMLMETIRSDWTVWLSDSRSAFVSEPPKFNPILKVMESWVKVEFSKVCPCQYISTKCLVLNMTK